MFMFLYPPRLKNVVGLGKLIRPLQLIYNKTGLDFENNLGNIYEECNYHDNALFPKLEPYRSQVNLQATHQPTVFLLACLKNELSSITADIEGTPSNPIPNITADRTNITLDHT